MSLIIKGFVFLVRLSRNAAVCRRKFDFCIHRQSHSFWDQISGVYKFHHENKYDQKRRTEQ